MEFGEKITLFIKVTGCLWVSSLRSAGPILYSFTIKLVIGPGKFFNYFGGGNIPHKLPLEASRVVATS